MKLVYLCGGINGLTDAEANDWRTEAKQLLEQKGIAWLDPMRRDYRGNEDAMYKGIVAADMEDIRHCTALLVNATRPSWGTAMEVWHAAHPFFQEEKKLVYAFVGDARVSPWLRVCCGGIYKTLAEAVGAL